ncbi:MAG: tetratricopeptide repeat protein [Deltaproteobacteria bacterium]|nr:tetratricopeptide repeat protein [Deltaproteobacteria bacterium]
MRQRISRLLALSLLVTAVAAVYGQVAGFSFVSFDDGVYITNNPHLRGGFTAEGVAWAFRATRSGHWHPLTWLSHMLDVELFGLWAGGHHLMSLLIHLANTLILVGLLERLTGSFWRSLTVAALFAFHPLHAETVAWVADRKDLLSTGLALLSVRAYVAYTRDTRAIAYLLSFSMFALALMAKSMVVTLPVLLLLLDYWPLRRTPGMDRAHDVPEAPSAANRIRRTQGWGLLIIEKAPFLMASFTASLVAVQAMAGGGGTSSTHHPISMRLVHALSAYLHHFVKTFDPTGLAVHYPVRGGIPLWESAAAVLLLAGVTVIAVYNRHRAPYLLTGWLWFAAALLPVSGLVALGSTPMADRYTYFPHIGLFIVLTWGAADLVNKHGSASLRTLLRVAGVGLLGILCLLCRQQVHLWQDSRTLFSHAVRISPQSALARNNLGLALASQGEDEEALTHFLAAMRVDPESMEAQMNLGIALARKGRIPEAAGHLEAAGRLQPEEAEIRSYLARCHLALGRVEAAEAACRKALALEAGHPRALINLGEVLMRQGRVHEAETAYRRGLRRFRGSVARPMSGLASALAAQGRLSEAVVIRRQLLSISPGYGENWYRLAVESYLMGDRASAVRYCRRARALGFEGLEAAFLERLERFGRGAGSWEMN